MLIEECDPIHSVIQMAPCMCVQVREGRRVQLTAVGADAVSNAVLAIGNARLFLEADHLDIKVGKGRSVLSGPVQAGKE